jgi:hypothetical protein
VFTLLSAVNYSLSIYVLILSRLVLYPAAFLALCGFAWRTQPLFSAPQIGLFFLGIVLAGLIFFVEKKSHSARQLCRGRSSAVPSNTQQHIIRHRTEIGTDRLEGTFLVEFQENQLTATLHIPFCPAFTAMPKIEVCVLDADDAKTTLVQIQPFGVRIDVKRQLPTAVVHLAVIAVAEDTG